MASVTGECISDCPSHVAIGRVDIVSNPVTLIIKAAFKAVYGNQDTNYYGYKKREEDGACCHY